MAGDAKDPQSPSPGDAPQPAAKQSLEASRSSSDNNYQSDSQTEEQPDMPPGAGSRRPRTPKREADLSGFLTGNEKHELSMLIAKITDGMQRQIYRVFDSTGVDNSKDSPPSFWSKLPASLRDFSLGAAPKADAKASVKGNGKAGKGNAKTKKAVLSTQGDKEEVANHAEETVQKEEKEALGASLQELKKETLQSFRRWQLAVNRRVGEISVKNNSAAQRGQAAGASWKKGPKTNNQNQATTVPKGEPFKVSCRTTSSALTVK